MTLERFTVATLTEDEVRLAQFVGQERHNRARARGVYDQRRSGRDPLEIDVDGIGAELAFCRLCNVYPDLAFTLKAGGADCRIGDLGVDVKSTRKGDPSLFVKTSQIQRAIDWYALMLVDWPRFLFVGAVRSRDVRETPPVDWGQGPFHVVPSANMGALLLPTDQQVEALVQSAVKADEIRWDIR